MRINYFFKHCTGAEKKQAEAYIASKAPQLEKLTKPRYGDAVILDATVERLAKKHAYKVTFQLHDPYERLYAFEDDHTIAEAVDLAKDKLVEQMKKNRDRYQARRRENESTRTNTADWDTVFEWVDERTRVTKAAFAERLLPLLAGLRRHVEREIGYAVMTGDLTPDAITADDVIDDAIVRLHGELDDRPDDLTLEQWSYQTVLALLKERILAWKNEHGSSLSLERDVKKIIAIDKKFTGSVEKKVDQWQPDDDLKLESLVVREAWVDPQERRSQEDLRRDLATWIRVLPKSWREVLMLHVVNGQSLDTIAKIQKRSVASVTKDLDTAKAYLKEQLQA
ncbi:HPF/RaiA family ribosome-associated protein [Candidatus Uhrbacteria bacterium]|nr:HPF/RaiA family ribosome-associated protein [Candidatus Uhrbacteria bacterium]